MRPPATVRAAATGAPTAGRAGKRAVLAAALLALPGTAAVRGEDEPERRHFILGEIRVFYSATGPSAVPPEDRDGNGVPDRVEDVARQVWAARELFCGALGFPDPFESERFGRIDCIQVSLRSKEELDGRNGVAYRLPQRAVAVPGGGADDRALVIAVATSVDPTRNPTPAHEFFHLVQYGATYLSNGWFLEGMARWSEAAWREGEPSATALAPLERWPHSEEERTRLFGMSYEAGAFFWNPVALGAERRKGAREVDLPSRLSGLAYSDGSPVLRGALPPAAGIMRAVLAELAGIDDRVREELGYGEWTLANQGAPENSPYLYEAVTEVLRREGLAGAGRRR